jgi:hypothetical protein
MIQRDSNIYWQIPSGINLNAILAENPPAFKRRVKVDVFYFVLDRIAKGLWLSNIENNRGIIDINSKWLQLINHHYLEYVNYLKANNIIASDNQYIIGSKSKGYYFVSLKPNLEEPIEEILVTNAIIRKHLLSYFYWELNTDYTVKNYKHLTKWFNEDLKIDYKPALKKLDKVFCKARQPKVYSKEVIEEESIKKFKNLIAINNIHKQSFFCTVDFNIGRFHSNLSTLNKKLRPFISYKGKNLVNIDVRNSQPLLSTAILKKEFWTREHSGLNIYKFPSALNLLSESPIPSKVVKSFSLDHLEELDVVFRKAESVIMLVTFLLEKHSDSFSEWIFAAESGKFYESIFKKIHPGEPFRKDEVKVAMLKFFFSENKHTSKDKKLIMDAFPEVTKVFERLKQKNHVTLSHILQRLESTIMIEFVSRRIASDKPDLPFFTIHDSIATFQEEVEYVKRVIEEEFNSLLGIKVEVGIERWEEK